MTAPLPTAADPVGPEPLMPLSGRRSRRRRWLALGTLAVVVAAVVGVVVINPFGKKAPAKSGVTDNAYPTSLATVHREDLISQTSVSATLGYASTYSAINQAHGTYTSLPSAGQVVSQGQVLYEVDGKPVVLLYGHTPAYRSLSEGSSAAVTGPDVAELNADLVALGYVTSAEMSAVPYDEFSYWTKVGVEDLQAHLGETVTGTLALGQAVFLPRAIKVSSVSATLGSQAGPGQPLLTASSTARVVTIDLDASQQSEVKVGDRVTITLPNGRTTPGVISQVGNVATTSSGGGPGGGSTTVTVEVTPTHPAATGSLDQAPVEVEITTSSVPNALVVPDDALVALAGGGYALEVVGANGVHRLVPVSVGQFDNANSSVQVSGGGLAPGMRVVVPGL